jgi:hypothetical protein
LAWTPFFPVNSTIPSLRVLLDDDMTDNQKREALLSKLDLLDSIDGRKKRLRAAEHAQVYQRQLSRAYEKKSHINQKDFQRTAP